MQDFVAIDFETANGRRSSVCSVGIVIVRGGEIVDKFYSLIQPYPNYYTYWTTEVHGLTRRDTDGQPTFPEVWAQVADKIKGLPLATRDMTFERTIIDISGEMVAYDNVHIAPGSRISINKEAVLSFGKDFNSTGNCTIICEKKISFGERCLLSWDIQIMDADFHKIFNEYDEWVNPPKSIEIGDNVWICSRATILKGTKIPNSCIIGAASVVTGRFSVENCIISGNGSHCRVVKSNIHWIQ